MNFEKFEEMLVEQASFYRSRLDRISNKGNEEELVVFRNEIARFNVIIGCLGYTIVETEDRFKAMKEVGQTNA